MFTYFSNPGPGTFCSRLTLATFDCSNASTKVSRISRNRCIVEAFAARDKRVSPVSVTQTGNGNYIININNNIHNTFNYNNYIICIIYTL
jgi:hypothetical protein